MDDNKQLENSGFDDDLEWEGEFQAKLVCDNCSYESDGFYFFAPSSPYSCENCHKVVIALHEEFFFIPPRCPECKMRLKSHNLIKSELMGKDDRVRCPACGDQSLRLDQSGSWMDLLFGSCSVLLPDVGSVIHGRISESNDEKKIKRLIIPQVATELLDEIKIVPNGLSDIPTGIHKFEVLFVSQEIFHLRWLGELTNEDCVKLIEYLDGNQ